MPKPKKFHKISWTRRMIITLVVATVMPAIILSSIIFNVAAKNLEKQAYELTDYKITQRVRFLELDLQQVFDLIYQTVVDPAVAGAMDSLNRGKEPVESKTTLRSKFISYGQMLEAVQSMTYIDNEGENYYTYEKFNSVYDNNMWSDKNRRLELCKDTRETESAVFLPTIKEVLAGGRQLDLFYIAIPVLDYVADSNVGVLVMGIGMGFFQNLDTGEDEDSRWNDMVEVLDSQGKIIYSQEKNRIGKTAETADPTDKNQLIKENKIEKSNWTLRSYVNLKEIKQNLYGFQQVTILIGIIFIVPFVAVVWALSKYFTKNLSMLSMSLKKIGEGQVGMQLDATIEDEFYPVIQQFNQMSKSIERLIKRLKRERAQTEEAVTRQRQAELRALESQINPHFLYNTLDSINWRAIENEEYEISEMISCLADLLRYSITDIDGMVQVKEEKQWLNKYLFLQQKRFSDKFTFSIHIPAEAEDILIHKMLLQPIIENCVVHGINEMKKDGRIIVEASVEEGKRLRFVVKDNGKGIGEKTLARLNRKDSRGDIGTDNVRARLESYYGGEAFIRYYSSGVSGTVVTMEIPYGDEVYAKSSDCGG